VGRLPQYVHFWRKLTSDREVLESVQGLRLEFENSEPIQDRLPHVIRFSEQETVFVNKQISDLLEKGAIVECEHEPDEFVNNIFLRPKKNGSWRMILNLKPLNEHVVYTKFKMDTLKTVLPLVKPNCYMTSLDLKDAYYSVKIAEEHQKYLKFHWGDQLYKFVVLPFGYAQAPRRFTKLMKPIYANLRAQGHTITGYIDDILIIGDDYDECIASTEEARKMIENCGFVINAEKSEFRPSKKVEFLGFIIDSGAMMVTLSDQKKCQYTQLCKDMLKKSKCTIRELSKLIGTLVSTFSGVQHGPLFFRELEHNKIEALRSNDGDYEALVALTPKMKGEINWWIENLSKTSNCIQRPFPGLVLETDSTKFAWGCRLGSRKAGGFYLPQEVGRCQGNINALELLAIKLALLAFEEEVKNQNVLIKCDNTTAVAYIGHMGGSRSRLCNAIAHEIWVWAVSRRIWLSIEHIPGVMNYHADFESRNPNERTEWSMDSEVFRGISEIFGAPDIDFFAARGNFKVARYCSWKPEPGCFQVNAFTLRWHRFNGYCFPPFSVIARCLQKIREDQAEAVVVVPTWTSQSWFTVLLKMLIADPVLLPKDSKLLTLPHRPEKIHPMHPKLQLMACKLSGKDYRSEAYRTELRKSSCSLGAKEPRSSIVRTSKNGMSFVIKDVVITCNPISVM
jgi:hypothetical protein